MCVCACVQQHEKQVREKKRTLKQVKKSIAELIEKNSELMKELESLNVAVNERRHIHDLSGGQTRRPPPLSSFFIAGRGPAYSRPQHGDR